jgi:hypothetical protein
MDKACQPRLKIDLVATTQRRDELVGWLDVAIQERDARLGAYHKQCGDEPGVG